MVKKSPANAGDTGEVALIQDWEDPLEEEMATHSSILAWEISWTEELVGYGLCCCNRVRRDLATE